MLGVSLSLFSSDGSETIALSSIVMLFLGQARAAILARISVCLVPNLNYNPTSGLL